MFVTKMPALLRIGINLIISVLWLAAFQWLGWVSFDSAMPFWQVAMIVAALAAVIDVLMIVIRLVTLPVYLIIAACTMLIGVFVIEAGFAYASLYFAGQWTHYFTITVPFWWQGLVMGLFYSLFKLRAPSESSSRS